MTTYTYKTTPGCTLEVDVLTPAGPGPWPVVVWIHGGALILGSRDWLEADDRDPLLRAGLAVAVPDYRLGPETKVPEIVADVRDLLTWVRTDGPALFGADPTRVAAVGNSAGGYLTLMAGVVATPPLQALVSFYGYGDILDDSTRYPDPYYLQEPAVSEAEARASVGTAELTSAGKQPRRQFYVYCRQQGRWVQEMAGLDPETQREALERLCPVRQVTPDYPPTLLCHGDGDKDVPYTLSVEMAEALARAGVPHELMIVPGAGHGWDYGVDDAIDRAFDRMYAFLQERLR
jgi:acetyl esterase/lipase